MAEESKDIQVSVYCTAYNHEKYIRKCLEGFVMQRGVRFEVIVHDDASTDGTADIIREYEKKYPEIIKPIYQTVNQHSQGVAIPAVFIHPKMTGKYTAVCEGDDYWTDPDKLKKQFDELEAHPDCKLCVHKVQRINADGSLLNETFPPFDLKSGVIDSKAFVEMTSNGHTFHFSSFFVVRENFLEMALHPPKFRQVADVGDIPIMLYFAQLGNVAYLCDSMSCYRKSGETSWNGRMKKNPDKYIAHLEKMLKMCDEYDEYTHHRFDLSPRINRLNVDLLVQRKDYKGAWKYIRKHPGKYNSKRKMYIFIQAYFPFINSLNKKNKGNK